MVYGKTRANTAGIRKKLMDQLRNKGLWTGTAVAVDRALGSSRTETTSKRKRATVAKKASGVYRKKRVKKLSPITKRPKINKKFKAKVDKCLRYNDPWMQYNSCHNVRLLQGTKDAYEYAFLDERGKPLTFNNPQEILHQISVLQMAKTDSDDYSVLTGNMEDQVTIKQISYKTSWFFKSTSSHVVNIEMFICTSKVSHSNSFSSLIDQSYLDYNTNTRNISATISTTKTQLCSNPNQWVELYKYFNVQKVSFKLNPGDYTSKTFSFAAATFDTANSTVNNVLDIFRKGGKYVFFRVINDISVSACDVGQLGSIHAWPSNRQGGVACRFYRRVFYKPVQAQTTATSTLSMNTIKNSEWQLAAVAGEADQQVVYQNPLAVATNAG